MKKYFTFYISFKYFYCQSSFVLILKFKKSLILRLVTLVSVAASRRALSLFYYRQGAEVLLFEYRFLTLGRFNFNFVVVLDLLRILFLVSVSLITAAVLVFRLSYMKGDKYFRRFHLLLMSFVIRMYFLILRPNLVRVLLG